MSARLLMLLDFLKGERQAKSILADMVEEDGDAVLAEMVRSRKPGPKKIFQLGLEIVPYWLATKLAIGFFEHAVSESGLLTAELKDNINSIESWIDQCLVAGNVGQSDDESSGTVLFFELACGQLNTMGKADPSFLTIGSFGNNQFRKSLEQLMLIVEVTVMIQTAQGNNDHGKRNRSNNRLRTEIVRGANQLRSLVASHSNARPRQWIFDVKKKEFSWQWQHLVESVEAAGQQLYV